MPLCWRRSSLYGAVRRKEKPSRYNWAYSNGSSMASAFNVHNPIREWSLSSSQLPNSQCEAYNQQKYKHQCCSCVDCILQIFLSSYRISLSFNQEEALEKASTLLEQLYGIDTDTLAVETEYDQALDGNGEIFTTDHITYRDEAAGISYMVSVNLQNGEIKTVSAEKDTGSNYSKEIAENAAQYQGLFLDAEKIAHAYMGENAVWTAKQIEYMRDEKQMLGTGIVNYIFVTDTDACVISYSCTQQYFYQVREFSKDELDSYLSDEKEQGAMRNLEQVITEVK